MHWGEMWTAEPESLMPALRARLTRFNQGIRDLKEGDRLTITYRPGEGTGLESKGGDRLVVEGKDFADALFSVWLGNHPVDAALQTAMWADERPVRLAPGATRPRGACRASILAPFWYHPHACRVPVWRSA